MGVVNKRETQTFSNCPVCKSTRVVDVIIDISVGGRTERLDEYQSCRDCGVRFDQV